ncbi:MAG: BadF/BadG/BcrA/BcrD ATPase family protein [Bryobacteraceae bacterium]
MAAIESCVGAACPPAGLDSAVVRFDAACLDFSGGPADKEPILRQLLSSDRLMVTSDAFIALSGAAAGEPGIVAIAGAGGWGYLFGDEGGAFSIVRQALRAALRHEEGWGPPTELRQALLEATGAASANDLLHRFYTAEFTRPRIASYAKLVDEVARQGDPVALEILQEAARQLSVIALAVRGRLFRARTPVRAAHVGGVFRSAILLEEYRRLLGIRSAPPVYGHAAGALLEAYRSAGLAPELSNLSAFKT